MILLNAASRTLELSDLLEYALGRCGHEPAGDNDVAVCETCAAVVTMLACRIREDRHSKEDLHWDA